jgi:alpha-glucosidase (family GH31 glycosyl hydrolase)
MNMVKWRVAHFVMTDNNNTRYSVPETAVPNPSDDQSMRLDMLGFSYTTNPFTFSFTDPTDSTNKFVTTEGCSLVFVDKFIQMDFKLPSKRIYGFGERIREFNLTEGTWTMWAIGQNSPYDDGTGRLGVYGVHPFILVQGKKKGDFFGMYFRNSNAQSPVLTYTDTGSTLSYIALGGQIEIFFFMHGTAQDIIKQY